MDRATLLGHFSQAAPMTALTGVELQLRAIELVAHWRRCGLTADWLAHFFAYDFAPNTRETAVSVLSTVINELLENAAKFSGDKQRNVGISVRHHGEFMCIETHSTAADGQVAVLRDTMDDLGREPLDELFARRMQTKALPGASGIGLLILKKDYGARLGVKLSPLSADEWDVQVRVELDMANVETT